MFEGQVDTYKYLNLLYDEVERHYYVIANLTGAMAKRYICKECHKSCVRDTTHVCDQKCCDCTASPPCAFFAYPATNVTDILEVGHYSGTTVRAQQ